MHPPPHLSPRDVSERLVCVVRRTKGNARSRELEDLDLEDLRAQALAVGVEVSRLNLAEDGDSPEDAMIALLLGAEQSNSAIRFEHCVSVRIEALEGRFVETGEEETTLYVELQHTPHQHWTSRDVSDRPLAMTESSPRKRSGRRGHRSRRSGRSCHRRKGSALSGSSPATGMPSGCCRQRRTKRQR